jgi:Raf kinase inhibitor-like YbhB/YbcL family protein
MHPSEIEKEFKPLVVSSPAFRNADTIPKKYTCEGTDINPPLDIKDIPENVKSLAIIVDDPDAPSGTWLHWLVWDIPVTHHIKENKIPGVQGMNDFKRTVYGGPCPPSGTHHYYFRVYGLDELVGLPAGASRRDLEQAMRDHILAYGELVGVYKKVGKNVKQA